MVNKGKVSVVITLDPIHHLVRIGSAEAELQPLSFALFAKLLEHKNEIVPVATLTDEVWRDVTVAPDTLKQRVFLLRKALEEAGIQRCEVQSVRGQGYRLIVPDDAPVDKPGDASVRGTKGRSNWRRASVIAIMLALFALYVWLSSPPPDLPTNNRVAFWSVTTDGAISTAAVDWQQAWITELSSADGISFIESQRDPEQTLSAQARQVRVALISRWVFIASDVGPQFRMQIIESKTAAVLRSDRVMIGDEAGWSVVLAAQASVIKRIMESDALPLSREALIDTDHPVWDKLRNLAEDPSR